MPKEQVLFFASSSPLLKPLIFYVDCFDIFIEGAVFELALVIERPGKRLLTLRS